MAQHRRTSRLAIALLTVFTLLIALFPALPERAAAADYVSLSKSDFVIGYPPAAVTLTGGDAFKFKTDARLYLFDSNNRDTYAVQGVRVVDSTHLTFTLNPGLAAGRYTLLVVSYSQTTVNLNVLTSYDPTNVTVTPGANADIRVDWSDPSALDIKDIVIQYSLADQNSYSNPVHLPRGVGTTTFKNLANKKAYKFMIYATKNDGTRTTGAVLNNGGSGYLAVDTTPPSDLTNLVVSAVPNGFRLTWSDPTNADTPPVSDLNLITVQYAEHNTSNWSEGFVVAKGIQTATLAPMNIAKRYDFRFTKLDVNGNWNYQIDTHNGYGYTWDTDVPADVTSLNVSVASDTSAYITWYDPQTTDFHHVNFYLKSPMSTDWVPAGHADKGLQSFQLNGLAPGIDYQLKTTTVDQLGNETSGATFGPFRTATINDLTDLTNLEVKQEVSGGLQMTWKSDAVSSIDFNRFKMYYAPINSSDPKDFKLTDLSNRGTKTASLRDMPRGLYKLDMRLQDTFGLMQSLQSFNNSGAGYYVSGTGNNLPTDVGNVKVLANDGSNLEITWDAATTNGTHVQIYVAERSQYPSWRLLGKVDKRNQRYLATGLTSTKDYFFKLVVVDANRSNQESTGVVYDNSGYGFNVIGGDRYAPHEVTGASATVNLNTLVVSYTEPSDTDFNFVNLYVKKVNSNDPINPVAVTRGNSGTTIRDLVPGASYTLRITTVDNYGNESAGIALNNNGNGYLIGTGTGQSTSEVRNAIAIPNSNQLTVRFQEPTNADYASTTISIKKTSESAYSQERTVGKGLNEATFTGLEPNSAYSVRLITTTTAGKKSSGIYLGTTGISMQPISNVVNPRVTPGANRLTVTWSDPSTTIPTGIAVEVMPTNKSTWSEPQIVQPGTGFLVLGGLSGTQAYKVRITTLRNEIGSPSFILDAGANGGGPGYTPRDASVAASPSHMQRGTATDTQWISLIGRNTRFGSYGTVDVTLYDSNGNGIGDAIKQTAMYSNNRFDVRLSRNLAPGTYTLKIRSNEDGDLTTTVTVQTNAPAPEVTSLNTQSVNLGYSSFLMTLNGDGFTNTSKIQVDNGTAITPSSYDSKSLTFQMPAGLQPGVHKVTVLTNGSSTVPMQFTVYPFKSQVGFLNLPGMRNGAYHGEWNVSNMDANPRNAKVILLIRRNGQFVEEQETTLSFTGNETKKIKVDFGGANTSYAIGPTQSISVQAFIVDANTLTPLADPAVYSTDLNL
ncbi:fibronectin type III domain-containing protein [Tumebacillus permanentifrigoris]|uniref:fibronectin type III domain-containing protein n=1 Tax=Tumebacillus permanentifrigoris TaxID=378543 RepID=UPI0011B1C75A|nr:fibronectin type III domain-containing protein [Tumebacillus permanentifrigoris]